VRCTILSLYYYILKELHDYFPTVHPLVKKSRPSSVSLDSEPSLPLVPYYFFVVWIDLEMGSSGNTAAEEQREFVYSVPIIFSSSQCSCSR
jgi:hypothetical protein